MESLLEQFFDLLFAAVIGATVGFIYDLYCLVRNKYRLKGLVSGFGDIVFWIILTVMVFSLLLIGNKGEVRFYILFGIVLGSFLYIRFLSSITVAVTLKISGIIKIVFTQLMRPFCFFLRLIFRNKYVKSAKTRLKALLSKLLAAKKLKK